MQKEAATSAIPAARRSWLPIDVWAGSEQEHVEDCPVCCRPNVVHVEVDDGGDVRVWAQGE
jgi:hypothetical protein